MLSQHYLRTVLPRSGALLLCAVTTGSVSASPPRILQVSSGSKTAPTYIREPVATPEITTVQPPPAAARRSEFVPIAVPEAAIVPPAASVPTLPAQPTFPPQEPVGTATAPQAASATRDFHPVAPAWQPGSPPVDAPAAAPATEQPAAQLPVANAAIERPPAAPAVSSQFEPLQPSPASLGPSPALPRSPSAAMQPVAERAMQKADLASTMAQRGMLYSARKELIEGLTLVARSLDVEQGDNQHAKALSAGLTALEEARDFARGAGQATAEVSSIAAGHRTPIFHHNPATPSSPVIAQQQYFSYAQEQIAFASGQIPAASQVLYRLGRLQSALAAQDADPLALHGPQAIVFHQAALSTDRGNWLAANELGVMYAKYGQLPAAKEMLIASVTTRPHLAGWQNLAAVHRQLGETDLAARAEWERQNLAKRSGPTNGSSEVVRWVDSKTFVNAGEGDVRWPAEVAARPAGASATARK